MRQTEALAILNAGATFGMFAFPLNRHICRRINSILSLSTRAKMKELAAAMAPMVAKVV